MVGITIRTIIIAEMEIDPKIEDKTHALLQYYIIQMHSVIYTNAIVILLKTVLVIRKLLGLEECFKNIKAYAKQ
jgi:hypothetical protein